MTKRLEHALREHRSLKWGRVLTQSDGSPLTQKIVQDHVERAARLAGVKPGVHRPRHTFCSHLAMKGASARAIQEVAGHQDLSTTQRYMHLSPAALDAAIGGWRGHRIESYSRGEIVEAAGTEGVK
jgi:site-specific recombinase XerD